MKDNVNLIVDEDRDYIRYSYAYSPTSFGQKRCYKCGSKARVRAHEHYILGETYTVCCSNPNCGVATSRNYAYRHNAVDAWNCKPTIEDKIYDLFLEKLFDKL